MTDPAPHPAFNRDMAESYDQKNSGLAPISDNLHFLVQMVLAGLPARARILCVGVGTGAEILSLARAFPEWRFTGVDPSAEMLEVCRGRLDRAGLLERCELIHGFAHDAPKGANFDAALAMLVAHFIGHEHRPGFYRDIHDRLKPGGSFVSAEICVDLDAPEFPAMLQNWEQVQSRMGATPEALQKLPDTLRHVLGVLSPAQTDDLLKAAGFALPVPFFQAFLIRGVFATRSAAAVSPD
ncbi:class I SAM-dependent methyltransferase [Paracoccus laeviglucosivorans]|uniref:tRNA (Cmo5U34)-methyltransferase n=1 Tax=Paracoccus laeviglucosivorans TaxID=1197861 RepID=A0A521DL13_9RHOB|nr:class I SAM-dependent methyltransferase [Paracoccus laeviglucosivorans]SMO72285.1 tRNA (cmo5U34)-methyltransferase [Paracoccus laeviglucosivorans]